MSGNRYPLMVRRFASLTVTLATADAFGILTWRLRPPDG